MKSCLTGHTLDKTWRAGETVQVAQVTQRVWSEPEGGQQADAAWARVLPQLGLGASHRDIYSCPRIAGGKEECRVYVCRWPRCRCYELQRILCIETWCCLCQFFGVLGFLALGRPGNSPGALESLQPTPYPPPSSLCLWTWQRTRRSGFRETTPGLLLSRRAAKSCWFFGTARCVSSKGAGGGVGLQ